jgi:hypothetical protein
MRYNNTLLYTQFLSSTGLESFCSVDFAIWPVSTIQLAPCSIEEKGCSQTPTENKHVLSTWSDWQTHAFHMALYLPVNIPHRKVWFKLPWTWTLKPEADKQSASKHWTPNYWLHPMTGIPSAGLIFLASKEVSNRSHIGNRNHTKVCDYIPLNNSRQAINNQICVLSFCHISGRKGKTHPWCWLAFKRHSWSGMSRVFLYKLQQACVGKLCSI